MSWAIWITGLPGSGKSAIARAAVATLVAGGDCVRHLELDALRRILTPEPLYDETERQAVYRALVVTARALTEAGVPVVIDATAHRREWRDLARRGIADFAEVQLLCPVETARERERTRGPGHHPTGIYARAGQRGATVPGVDIPYEPAVAPELAIDTTSTTVTAAAGRVVSLARSLARGRATAPAAAGWTLWVTGQPGSGKATVVRGIRDRVRTRGDRVSVLQPRELVAGIAPVGHPSDRERDIATRAIVVAAMLLNEAGVAAVIDGAPAMHEGLRLARDLIRHIACVELVCAPDVAHPLEHQERSAAPADLVVCVDALDAWTATSEVMPLVDRLARSARETPRVHQV